MTRPRDQPESIPAHHPTELRRSYRQTLLGNPATKVVLGLHPRLAAHVTSR